MSAEEEKDLTFEQGLARLEELIKTLENGELDLDKSLNLFEEGIKLTRQLNQKLDESEKRLELLLKDEEGRLLGREFSLAPDEVKND
ncbi:MAG: exodeoxyribonuclease VII small subunit [Thermodesulfobacteriota bacterium]